MKVTFVVHKMQIEPEWPSEISSLKEGLAHCAIDMEAALEVDNVELKVGLESDVGEFTKGELCDTRIASLIWSIACGVAERKFKIGEKISIDETELLKLENKMLDYQKEYGLGYAVSIDGKVVLDSILA